jgi:hypothetical protein
VVEDAPLTFDLLANDTEHGDVSVALVGAVSAQAIGASGGQASVDPNGLLSYQPPAGDAPYRETFQYRISSPRGSSTATITAIRTPTLYVDNRATGQQDGSKGRPFATLQQALTQAGSLGVTILVAAGDGTSKGLDMPVVTLVAGQSILGLDPANPPVFSSQFVLPTIDCSFSNLKLKGVGSGPLITVSGNIINPGLPTLVLSNLTLQDHDGVGLELAQPTATELTGLTFDRTNKQGGDAVITLTDPLGAIKASNLNLEVTAPCGLLVKTTMPIPFPGDPKIPVEFDGLTSNGQAVPVSLESRAGSPALILNTVAIVAPEVLTTFLQGSVSGNASVDATLTNFDATRLGAQTTFIDWSYDDQSTGTFRIGNISNDYDAAASRSNPINFTTNDSSSAAYVSSSTHLSAANRLGLEAHDNSRMKVRVENYTWVPSGNVRLDQNPVYVYADGTAQTFSRFVDRQYLSAGYISSDLRWYTYSPGSMASIEDVSNLPDDNPSASFIFLGSFNDQSDVILNDPALVPLDLTSIVDAPVGSLDIPTF